MILWVNIWTTCWHAVVADSGMAYCDYRMQGALKRARLRPPRGVKLCGRCMRNMFVYDWAKVNFDDDTALRWFGRKPSSMPIEEKHRPRTDDMRQMLEDLGMQ